MLANKFAHNLINTRRQRTTSYLNSLLCSNWVMMNERMASKVYKLTVPSSIFNSACWTPSPETSLLRLILSACKALKLYNQHIKYMINAQSKCACHSDTVPSSLFYQLRQCRRFLAEQQLCQNRQPRVQKKGYQRSAFHSNFKGGISY